jgi:DNA-binding transcriptional LysR family regulator
LLERLVPALADIRRAVDDLNQLKEKPSGTLRINAPAPAVDHLLCPLVFEFMRLHEEVNVEIVSDAAVIDIVKQGFDAGVRFGKQLEQDMVAMPLGPSLRYAIVASRSYIDANGRPTKPADLVHHQCIRRRFPGGTLAAWQFEKEGERMELIPEARLTLNSAQNELQAALAGHGLAHVLENYAAPYVEDGRLVEVLGDWSPRLPSWFLYYPNKRHSSAAMRAFLDFVRAYTRDTANYPQP